MSSGELVEGKETENKVDGTTPDVDKNVVTEEAKDPLPLSNHPDQQQENSADNVEARSEPKDEDAERCKDVDAEKCKDVDAEKCKDDVTSDAIVSPTSIVGVEKEEKDMGPLKEDTAGETVVEMVDTRTVETLPDSSISAVEIVEKEEMDMGPLKEDTAGETVVEMVDARSVETLPDSTISAVEIDVAVKEGSASDVPADSSGLHDDREVVKLKSDKNDDNCANETCIDVKKNEPGDVHCLNEECRSKSENNADDEKGDGLKDNLLDAKMNNGDEKDEMDIQSSKMEAEDVEKSQQLRDGVDLSMQFELKKEDVKGKSDVENDAAMKTPNKPFFLEPSSVEGYESGTEEEQAAFTKEVETFYRENGFEFKAPKFYKEELNLLKLWRAVIKLGGYDQVTSCKLWRHVGESFKPPKTCTTVSWTFRIFYEKALLEYEKHKMRNGELPFSDGSLPESIRDENQLQAVGNLALGSGRVRRDAAARAMQGWHSQRLLGNGQVSQPIIKDKNLSSTPKADKQQKTNGLLKRKKPSTIVERPLNVAHVKTVKQQGDSMVIDIGPPADWVKVNVQRTNDCFEIYALVPGLLREEVHVQSDPAGRLIISGQPEQLDNPWGVTPFKKVVSLPSRIDPHQTSAVVTLHGQLFVRVPFEQSDV